jgi:hypothetical protein
MAKSVENLLSELINSVEEDIRSIDTQLKLLTSDKIVDIRRQTKVSSLQRLHVQYRVLQSVLRDEATYFAIK